jgi:hypothetical protein
MDWKHLAAAGMLLFAAAQWAGADSVALSDSKDTTIFSGFTSNSAGATPGMFGGVDGNKNVSRSLVQFPISGNIPAGATVTSAYLVLYLGQVAGSDTTPRVFELHRLAADWGEGSTGSSFTGIAGTGQGFAAQEGDATWSSRFFSATSPKPWTFPGGDFIAATSASAIVGQALNAPCAFNSTPMLVSDVQGWLNDRSSNHGWLIENTDETDPRTFRAFWTREQVNPALHPQLQITFTSVPEPAGIVLAGLGAVAALRCRRSPCSR